MDPDRLPRSQADLLADPMHRRYLEGWPRPGDLGIVAEAGFSPVGAAWLLRFPPTTLVTDSWERKCPN